jgi:hypothetical protein
MRFRFLSLQRKLALTIEEKDCLLLPTQMAYSGKRRAGQTKLEIKLRRLGLLPKGEVLNPRRGEYRMGFLSIGQTCSDW